MKTREKDIRQHIIDRVESGEYAPGSRLPTERALSETLMVGRSAVRSALAVLEGEGLVFRMAGSGTFVSAREEPEASADLRLQTSPYQVMEARLTIEPRLAHLVCSNATQVDFDLMDECVKQGGAAVKLEEFEHWDAALHEAIAVATRNSIIVEAYRIITLARDGSAWGDLKRKSLTAERRALYQDEHERIVAALRRRDAATGEAVIREHLLRIRNNMLGI